MYYFSFLLIIVFCDPAITCNGKGICNSDGTCNCEASFYGESCTSKLRILGDKYQFIWKLTFFIYLFFLVGCHYLFTCSDHGSCSDTGTCQCVDGFYGDNCSSKLYNFCLIWVIFHICILLLPTKTHLNYQDRIYLMKLPCIS